MSFKTYSKGQAIRSPLVKPVAYLSMSYEEIKAFIEFVKKRNELREKELEDIVKAKSNQMLGESKKDHE